jgi:hypothetical protein
VLRIHEWTTESGLREEVLVGAEDGALAVRVAGETTLLPMAVLDAVMTRYGRPLADGVPLEGPSVELGEGKSLRCIRFLPNYDVIAKDYVVWSCPGREPLVELATGVSAALVHFVEAARAAGTRA